MQSHSMRKAKLTELLESVYASSERLMESNERINQFVAFIDSGYSMDSVPVPPSEGEFAHVFFELAMSRIKVRKKFNLWRKLWLDSYSASFSTPEIIGRYRSERLRGNRIIDLGSGAGMQAIMFSAGSSVIAVEENYQRFLLSKINANAYSVKIKFVKDDAINFLQGFSGSGDILYSDPLRTWSGKSTRLLSPDPYAIRRRALRTHNHYVFDLPPRTPIENIWKEDEAEYISLNHRLIRLTEYSRDLSRSRSSAVMFPGPIILSGYPSAVKFLRCGSYRYLNLPDEALVAAGLLRELDKYGEFCKISNDDRRLILGSREKPVGLFPGETYEVLTSGNSIHIKEAIEKMKPLRVYLRFKVEPEKYYSIVSGFLSKPGSGDAVYLFRDKDRFVLTKKVS